MKKGALIAGLALLVATLLWTAGAPEAQATGGQHFVVSVDNVGHFPFTDSGVFNTPVGAGGPGAAGPGQAYEWTFYGHEGDRLSFATMFVQSNDWFFAPDELGIPLYKNGAPVSGDVTDYVKLWDAGTEGDEPVGTGPFQAPRQPGADSGPADPTNYARRVLRGDIDESALVKVTLTPLGGNQFRLRIENISGGSATPTPIAPGVGVVHNMYGPLFINGQADRGYGMEALAEDGDPSGLAAFAAARTGVNTPFAPVAWTVHQSVNALFTPGTAASAGLESLAEDGSPAALVAELGATNSGAAAIGRGASGPGPIVAPSGNYSFEITAMPGDHLSMALMFVQSNDWFFAVRNLPLFDANGRPRSGAVDPYIRLYDAGTEVDETPGFGLNQAPRQAGPNTGTAQGGVIHTVDAAGFTNPAQWIHVTVTPIN